LKQLELLAKEPREISTSGHFSRSAPNHHPLSPHSLPNLGNNHKPCRTMVFFTLSRSGSIAALVATTTLLLSRFAVVSSAIVLSELMIEPTAVSKANGTWFEFYNNGNQDFSLSGYKIGLRSLDANGTALVFAS
jgi:hypothetical protein